MFDLRGFILGCFLVALFLGAYYGPAQWSKIQESLAVRSIQKCADQSNATACARPYVAKLLKNHSGADVMSTLSAELPPMSCHYIGHVVGQEVYVGTKDVEAAIATCNRQCDSACVHGIIGGAFADALGLDGFAEYDIDLKHLGPDEIRSVGKRLCTTIGTCHGVGHALFQVYQDFEPAFAVCREVAGEKLGMCYNGVTMEFADALTSRSMASLPHLKVPEEAQLDSLCVFPTIQESRACFRYFPRMVRETLSRTGATQKEALARVEAICASYDSVNMQMACYAGLGSYWSYQVLRDSDVAVRSCEGLDSKLAVTSCIMGRLGVATEDRAEPLAAYCEASSEEYQQICYQGLFSLLDRVGVSDEQQAALCTTDNQACLDGLSNKDIDPLKVIMQRYAR